MLTKTITLKFGLKVGENTYKTLTLREPITADLLDAEDIAPVTKRLRYNAAVIAKTLESADDFKGPFSMGMLGKLKPCDFNALQDAMHELEAEAGEALSAD